MSLNPTGTFDPDGALEGVTTRQEILHGDRAVASVSPINEGISAWRTRSATERIAPVVAAPASAPISGSPLPVGTGGSRTQDAARNASTAVPGRSLVPQSEPAQDAAGAQNTLNSLTQALPLVQKLLPLLDGGILAAVGSLLAPRPHVQEKVDLAPLESHMTDLQLIHHDLRGKVTEQTTSLRRVEDQLEMVKEATDRNTLEQQELMEDLRSLGSKFNFVAALIFGLLVLSVLLNVLLFMHLQTALP